MDLSTKLKQAISYDEYVALIDHLVKEGKTTGPNQSEAYVGYTKLNKSRMKRVSKRIELSEDQLNRVKSSSKSLIFLGITESWCPDAATNLPVFSKLCEINPHFELKLLMRDEHLDLMDLYLTNGGRSIPKVLFIDNERLEVQASWGPRPHYLQEWLARNKISNEFSPAELTEKFQRWYIEDRGQSTLNEILNLL